MLSNNNAFNQPIGDWATSSVPNMSRMVQDNNAFNQPIGDCENSSVTNMDRMFCYNGAFNQPIGNWDTSQVTTTCVPGVDQQPADLPLDLFQRHEHQALEHGRVAYRCDVQPRTFPPTCTLSRMASSCVQDASANGVRDALLNSRIVPDQRCVQRADRDYAVLGDSVWPPLSGSKSPPHLEWRAFAPSPGTYWTVRGQPLKVSSVFFGIGSEIAALNLLFHEHEPGDVAPFAIVHSATLELRAAARDTLQSLSDCPLFGDLMELLPFDVKSLVCHKNPPLLSVLEKLIIGNQVALSLDAWCYRLKQRVTICMGDIAICGVFPQWDCGEVWMAQQHPFLSSG